MNCKQHCVPVHNNSRLPFATTTVGPPHTITTWALYTLQHGPCTHYNMGPIPHYNMGNVPHYNMGPVHHYNSLLTTNDSGPCNTTGTVMTRRENRCHRTDSPISSPRKDGLLPQTTKGWNQDRRTALIHISSCIFAIFAAAHRHGCCCHVFTPQWRGTGGGASFSFLSPRAAGGHGRELRDTCPCWVLGCSQGPRHPHAFLMLTGHCRCQ